MNKSNIRKIKLSNQWYTFLEKSEFNFGLDLVHIFCKMKGITNKQLIDATDFSLEQERNYV